MSWSPDLFIGEFRPWPDTVHVVRGKTDETRRYVPEEMLFHERDGHDEQFERARSLQAENAKLRELVRHLRECTRHNVCAVCEYADDACDFDYDLRELGIEVVA